MQWSDIPLRPSPGMLRQFAGLWLVLFAALAVWQALVAENRFLAATFALLAFTLGPLGLIWPWLVRPVFVVWVVAVFPMGWGVSHLMLALVFYGLFTPLGLLFRLFGRDVLRLRADPEAVTYWAAKPPASGVRSYFRQS